MTPDKQQKVIDELQQVIDDIQATLTRFEETGMDEELLAD
ncbi:hypothetical protein LCGC14_0265160 [marine sediment metagenome]|uniref:Uncharacterized protein n=1 Tax=marine sediment metagenome TaxID=412755 RepID=A0A0F9WL10_9ZZZZ